MTNSAKGSANFRVPVLSNAEDLINSVDTFIFDCDGVIWKGETLIDGVPETLDMLRSRGKSLVFMTNNSTKSRKQYRKKFEALGLTVQEVYVIGGEGILQELELCGIKGIGGPEDRDKTIQFGPGFFIEHDKDVGAVVVGFDQFINFYKIQYGTLCIRENPGCLFIATNCDAVGHFTDAQEWAGGGSMVGAIKGSTQKEPLVLGKPSTFMMDHVSKKFETDKSKICMVGDRLDTDILFGINSGCKTLLVLSGVTTLSMLQSPENDIQPDFYTEKVSNLLTQNDTDV
ncbi:phosphoglycolate phosphatase 1A, chloroplastic isoform X5 [Cryptomeria japonica]|uniref:phosphoglycolate phosphatase 1A, chloroplastic isoform X5 n=1 Tax=Cryptomeria japonica TaxID=3369 RepID=UPI0027DA8BB4|nr:phosphoglycolate phosphatase 1A, chloroplastic isoform X5 [Cryptomeria japonica]